MESLATLVPFEIEVDWTRVVGSTLRVATILLVGALAYLALRLFRNRIGRMPIEAGPAMSDRLQRRKTLASVMSTTGLILIAVVTLMMVLSAIGLPMGPLLATAGIASLAVGFGAQTLVKDIIGGVFILLEDQYSIGDVVRAAGVDGVVEEINLRTTILRDIQGAVHVVPNGEIRVVSNQTKGWSRAVLEIGVDYREDPDRVIAILEDLAAEIAGDPVFGALLLETPTVPGVEAFGDSAVTIRMMAKTLPLKQWDVARELRRRIKHRFDAEGIEIPFPQRTIWHRHPGGEALDDPASVGAGAGS